MSPSQPGRRATQFRFRIYVSGMSENSVRARSNIEALCRDLLKINYELEVIDIVKDPRRALNDGIIVTPTLLRISPLPQVKLMGDLSDTESMRSALGL